MWLYGKKIYHKLSDILSHDRNIVIASLESFATYLEFSDHKAFYYWYINTAPQHRYFHEVIRPNYSRKFFLDLDGGCRDDIHIVVNVLKSCFNVEIRPIIFESHGPIKTSYHIVVPEYSFPSHDHCRFLAQSIKDLLPNAIANNIDISVYSTVRCFRLEGSKKGIRIKQRIPLSSKTCDDFIDGMITYTDRCQLLTFDVDIPETIHENTCHYNQSSTIPDGFKIRKIVGNTLFLDRVFPTYCPSCQRIHDRENAAIINGKYVCWRNFRLLD